MSFIPLTKWLQVHLTLNCTFLIVGLCACIETGHCSPLPCCQLPDGSTQLAAAAAFAIEGQLLAQHSFHNDVEQAAHYYLSRCAFTTAGALVLSGAIHPDHSLWLAGGRGIRSSSGSLEKSTNLNSSVLNNVQGSWFISVAVLLFLVTTPPTWARNADGVALLFVWNVAAVGAIGGVVLICCTKPLQNGSLRGSTVEADSFCPLFWQQSAPHFHLCELDEVESAL